MPCTATTPSSRTTCERTRLWNTEHHPTGLGGALTPLQAWEADPTPVDDVPACDLAWFALEDDGRTRTITTGGVTWRRRAYIAAWSAARAPLVPVSRCHWGGGA